MTAVLISAAYALGMVWAFRYTFRAQVENERQSTYGQVDGEFVAITMLLAFIMSIFWPAVVCYACFSLAGHGDPQATARLIGGESRKAKQDRRERELAEREAHVAQLEKELGIGQDADVVPLRRERP